MRFRYALSHDFSEYNGSSEEKGWCLHHTVSLFAPPFRKKISHRSRSRVWDSSHQVLGSEEQLTFTCLFTIPITFIVIHWLILPADGQKIRKILTSSSELKSLCYFPATIFLGEYCGVRDRRGLWVNTESVCDWVVTCLVLPVGGAALLEAGALLLKMTLRWVGNFYFLQVRILMHKTIMCPLQLLGIM